MKIQLKINTTANTVNVLDVPTGNLPPLVINKPDNVANYELFDVEAGLAPAKIFAKRKGDDLYISLTEDDEADIIIKDYYDDHCLPPVIGLTESGMYQAFIPETLQSEQFIINLNEDVLAAQVLGGDIHACAAPFLFSWLPFLKVFGGLVGFAGLTTLISDSSDGGSADNALPAPELETPNTGALVVNKVSGATQYEITHLQEGSKRPTVTKVELNPDGSIHKITQIKPNGEVVTNPENVVEIVDGKIVLHPDQIQDGSPVSVVAKDDNGRVSPPATATVAFDDDKPFKLEVVDPGLQDVDGDGSADRSQTKIKTEPNAEVEFVHNGKPITGKFKADVNGNVVVNGKFVDENGKHIDPNDVYVRATLPGRNPKTAKLGEFPAEFKPETPFNNHIPAPELSAVIKEQDGQKTVEATVKKPPVNVREIDVRVDKTPDDRTNEPENTVKLTQDKDGNWQIQGDNPLNAKVTELPNGDLKVEIPVTDNNISNGNIIDAVARNDKGVQSEPSNAVTVHIDNGTTEAAPTPTETSKKPVIGEITSFNKSNVASEDPTEIEFTVTGADPNAVLKSYVLVDGKKVYLTTENADGNGTAHFKVPDPNNVIHPNTPIYVEAIAQGKLPVDAEPKNAPPVPRGPEHSSERNVPEMPEVITHPNTDDGSATVKPKNPNKGDELTVAFQPPKGEDPNIPTATVSYTFDGKDTWTTTVPEANRKGLPESFKQSTGLVIPEEKLEDGSDISAVVKDYADNPSPQNTQPVGYDNADRLTPPPVVHTLESLDTESEANRTIEKVRAEIGEVSVGDTVILRTPNGELLDRVTITDSTPKKEIDGKTVYIVEFIPPSNNPVVAGDNIKVTAQSPNKGESQAVSKTVPAVEDGNQDDKDPKSAVGEDGKPLPEEDTYGGHTEKNPPSAPAILVGGDSNTGEAGNNYATVTIPPQSDKLVLELTPKGGSETSVILTENPDGSWNSSHPNIIPNLPAGTERFTIPAGTLADNSKITAQAKDIAGNASAKTETEVTAYGKSATPTINEDGVNVRDPNGDGKPDQLEVKGKVLNEDGTPVAEGTPVVLKDQNGKVIGTGVTDKEGNYTITTPLVDGGVVDVKKIHVEATEKGKAPSQSPEKEVPALTTEDSTPPEKPVHVHTDNPGEVKFTVDPKAKKTTASFTDENGVKQEIEVNHETGTATKKDGSPLPENVKVTVDKAGNSFTIDANSIKDNSQVEATSSNEGGDSPVGYAHAGNDKGEQTNGNDNLPVGQPLTPPTAAKEKTATPTVSKVTARDDNGEAKGEITSLKVEGNTEPNAVVTITDGQGNSTTVQADDKGNYTGIITAPKGGKLEPNSPLTVKATAPNKTESDPAEGDWKVPEKPTEFADTTPPTIAGKLDEKGDVIFELPNNAKEGETVLIRIPSAVPNEPATEVLLTKGEGKWNIPAGKEDLVKVEGNTATVPDAATGPDVLVTATATDLAGQSATAEVPAGREQTPTPKVDQISPLDTSPAHDNDPEQFRVVGHLPKKPNGEEYSVGTKITIQDDKGNVIGTGVITENDDGTVNKDGTFEIIAVEDPSNPIKPITGDNQPKFKVIAEEPQKLPSDPAEAPVSDQIEHIGDSTAPAPGDAEIDYSSGEPVGKVTLPTNGDNKPRVEEGDKATITVSDGNGNSTFVVGATFTNGKWVCDPAPNHNEGELNEEGTVFTIPTNKLAEGNVVTVVTHDKLGNRSEPDSATVIGETPAVSELTVQAYDGDSKADRDPDLFHLQGKTTAPAGSQVTITANGKVVATATVEAGNNGENTFSVKFKESAVENIKVGDHFTATVEQDGKRPSKPMNSEPVKALEDFNPADHIGDREKPTAPTKIEPTDETGNQEYSVAGDVDRIIVNIVPTGKEDNDTNTAVVTITRGADGKWHSNRPDLVDHGDVVTADGNNGSTLTIQAGKGTVKTVTAVDLAGNSSDSTSTPPAVQPSLDDFKEDSTAPSATPITVDDDGSVRFDLPSDAKEGDYVALTFGKKDPNGGNPTDEKSIVLKKQGNGWTVVDDANDSNNKTGKTTDADLKTKLGLTDPITGNTLTIPRDKVIALGEPNQADDISVATIGADPAGNKSLEKKANVEFTKTPTEIKITEVIDDSFEADKNPERFTITAKVDEADGTVVTAKDKNGKVIGTGVVEDKQVTIYATERDGSDIKEGDKLTLEAKAPNKAYSQPSEGSPVPAVNKHTETVPPADPVFTVDNDGNLTIDNFPKGADEVELKVGDNSVKVVKKPNPTEDNPSAVTFEVDPKDGDTGVTVDPTTGKITIPAANVPKKEDGSIDPDKVTAQGGDLAGNKSNEVHPTPPAVPMQKTATPDITEIIPVNLDNPSDRNPEQLIVRGTSTEPDGTMITIYDHKGNPIGTGEVKGGKFEVIATEKDHTDNDIQLGKGQKISATAKNPNKTLSDKAEENLDDNNKVGEMTHPNDGYAQPPVITPDGKVIFPKDTKEGDITIEREGKDPISIKVKVDDEGNPSTDNEQIPTGNLKRDPQTGEIVVQIPKEVIIPEGTPAGTKPPVIKASDKDIAGNSSTETEREFGAAPHSPDVVANPDGTVDVFYPPHSVVGDRLVVNYDPEDEHQGNFTEVVFEKQRDGSWTKVSGDPSGDLIIANNKITLPADKVTDNSVVSSYAHNSVARSLPDEDVARPAAGNGTGDNATPLNDLSATFVDENEDPADGIAENVVVTGKTDPFAEVLVIRGDTQVPGRADKDGNFTVFVPVTPNANGENDETPFSVTATAAGKTPTTKDTTPAGMIFKDKTAPHIDVDPTPHGAEVLFPNKPAKGDKVEVFETPKGGDTPEQPKYEYTFNGKEWEVTGGTDKDNAPTPKDNRIDVPAEAGSKVKGKITDLAGNSSEEEVPVGEQVQPLPPVEPAPQPEAPKDTKAPSPAPVKPSLVDGSVTVEMPEDAEVGDKVNVKLTPTDPSILPETLPEGVTKNDDGTITVTLTKQPDGGWSSPLPNIVPPVPTGSNSTTIPEDKLKDNTKVETQAEDPAGNQSEKRDGTAGADAKTPTPIQITAETVDLSDKADENGEKAVIKGKVPNVPKGTPVFLQDKDGNPIAETVTTTDDGDFTFTLVENGFEGKLPNGEPHTKVPSVDVGDNFLIYAKDPTKKASEKAPAELPAIEPATDDNNHGGHQGDTTTPEAPTLKPQAGKGEGGVVFGTPTDTIPGDKVRLSFTDENDQPHNVELTHQPDGSWAVTKVDDNDNPTPAEAENVVGFSNIPAGQTTAVIPEDKLKDGENVTAKTHDQAGKESIPATAKAGNDEVTDTPTITGVTVKDKNPDPTSGADFDPEEVTVTGESNEPNGTKIKIINPETGEILGEGEVQNGKFTVTLEDDPSNKLQEGTPLKAVAEAEGKDPSDPSNEEKVPPFSQITDPTDETQFDKAKTEHEGDSNHPGEVQLSEDKPNDADGSITLTLPSGDNLKIGDKVAVLLTPEQGENGGEPAEMPVVLTYGGDGVGWTSSHPNLIPDVPAGNTVIIPEDSLKDGSPVKAFSYDPAGNKSPVVEKKAGLDDRTPLSELSITPVDGSTKADSIADAVQLTAKTDNGASLELKDKDNTPFNFGADSTPLKADDKGLVNVVILRHGLSEEDKTRIKDHFTKQAGESNGKFATPTFVELQSEADNAKIDQPADPANGDKPSLSLTATLKDEAGENLKDPSEPLTGEIRPLHANATDHPFDGNGETGENAGKPTAPGLEAPKRYGEDGQRTDKTDEEIGSAVLTLPNDAIVGDKVRFEFLTEGNPNDPNQPPELKTVTVVKTDNGWEGLTDKDKEIITGDPAKKHTITIDGDKLTISKDYVKDHSPVRATSIDQAGKESPYNQNGKDFVTTDFDEVTLLKEPAVKAYDLDTAANSNPEVLKITGKSEAGATLSFTVTDAAGKEHKVTYKVPGNVASPGVETEFTVFIVEHGKTLPNSGTGWENIDNSTVLTLPEGADIVPSKPKAATGETPAKPEFEPNVKITAEVIGEKAPSAESAVVTPALANDQDSHPNDKTDPTAAPTITVVEKLGASGEFTEVNGKKVGTDDKLDGEHGALVGLPTDAVAGDKVEISFRQEKEGTPDTEDTTVTFTKQEDGTWQSDKPEILANTKADNKDTVVIPADKIEGRSPSTITAQTIDQAGRKSDSDAQTDDAQPNTETVPKDRATYIDGLNVIPQDLGADNGGDGSKMDGQIGQVSDKDPEQLKLVFSVEEGATVTIEVLAVDPETGKVKVDESGKEVVAFTKVLSPTDYVLTGKVENNVDPDNVFTRGDVEYTLMESDPDNTGSHQFSSTDKVRLTAKKDGKAKGTPQNGDVEVGDIPNDVTGHPADTTAPVVSVEVGNEADKRPKAGSETGEMEDNPDVGKAYATVTFPSQADATEVTITFVPQGQGQIQTAQQDFVYERKVKADKSEVWALKKDAGTTVPTGLLEEIPYSKDGSTLKIPAEAVEHSTNILVKAKDYFNLSSSASKTLPADLVTKQPTLSVKAKDQSVPADGNPDDFIFTLNGEAGSVVTITVTKPATSEGGEAKTYSFDVTLPGNVDSTQNVTADGTPVTHTLREHGVTVDGEAVNTNLTKIAENLGFTLDVGDKVTAVAKATGKAASQPTADTTIGELTKHTLDPNNNNITTDGDFADKAVEGVRFTKTRTNGQDSVVAQLPKKDTDSDPEVGNGDKVTFTFPYDDPNQTLSTPDEATVTFVYDGDTKKWKLAENGDPNNTGITVEADGFTVNFPAAKIHADRGTTAVPKGQEIKITAVSEDLAGNIAKSEQEVEQDKTVMFRLEDNIKPVDKASEGVSDRNPEYLKLEGEAEEGAIVTFTVKTTGQADYVVKLLAVDESKIAEDVPESDRPQLPAGVTGYLPLTNAVPDNTHYNDKVGSFSYELKEPADQPNVQFAPSAVPNTENPSAAWTVTKASTVTATASIDGKASKDALNAEEGKEFTVHDMEHGNSDFHDDDTRAFSFETTDSDKAYFYNIGTKPARRNYYQGGEDVKFETRQGGDVQDLVIKLPQADAYILKIGLPYRGTPESDVSVGTPPAGNTRTAKTEYFTYTRQDDGSWKLDESQKPLGKIAKGESGEGVDLPASLPAGTESLTILGEFLAPSTNRPKVENTVKVQITDLAGNNTANASVLVPVAVVAEKPQFTAATFADSSAFADDNPDVVTYTIDVYRPQEKPRAEVTLVLKRPKFGDENTGSPEVILGKVRVPELTSGSNTNPQSVKVLVREAKDGEQVTGETRVEIDNSTNTATLIVPKDFITQGMFIHAVSEIQGAVASQPAESNDAKNNQNLTAPAIDRGEAQGQSAVRHTGDEANPSDVDVTPAPTQGQAGYKVGDSRVTVSVNKHNPDDKSSIYLGDFWDIHYTPKGTNTEKTVRFKLQENAAKTDWEWVFEPTANTPTNPFEVAGRVATPTGTKDTGYTFNITDVEVEVGSEISSTRIDFAGKNSTTQRANLPDNRFDKDDQNTNAPTLVFGTTSADQVTGDIKSKMVVAPSGHQPNSGDVVIKLGDDNVRLEISYYEPQSDGTQMLKTILATSNEPNATKPNREWKFFTMGTGENAVDTPLANAEQTIKVVEIGGKQAFILQAAKVSANSSVDVTAYGAAQRDQSNLNNAKGNVDGADQPQSAVRILANFDDSTPEAATAAGTQKADANNAAVKGDVILTPQAETVEMKIVFKGDDQLPTEQDELLRAGVNNTLIAKRLDDKQWQLYHEDGTTTVSPTWATIGENGVVTLSRHATKSGEPVTITVTDAYGNTATSQISPDKEADYVALGDPSVFPSQGKGMVDLGDNATKATVTIVRKNAQGNGDVTDTVVVERTYDDQDRVTLKFTLNGVKLEDDQAEAKLAEKGIVADNEGNLTVSDYDQAGENIKVESELEKAGQAKQTKSDHHTLEMATITDPNFDRSADAPDVIALNDGSATITGGQDNRTLEVKYFKDGSEKTAKFTRPNLGSPWTWQSGEDGADQTHFEIPSTAGTPITLKKEHVDDFTFVNVTGSDERDNNATDRDVVVGDDDNSGKAITPTWGQHPTSKDMIMTPGKDNVINQVTFTEKDSNNSKLLVGKFNKEAGSWELFTQDSVEQGIPKTLTALNDPNVATIDPATGVITINAQNIQTDPSGNTLQAKGWDAYDSPSDVADTKFNVAPPSTNLGNDYTLHSTNDGSFVLEVKNPNQDQAFVTFKVIDNNGAGSTEKWIRVTLEKSFRGVWSAKTIHQVGSIDDKSGTTINTNNKPFEFSADNSTNRLTFTNGGGHRLFGDSQLADTQRVSTEASVQETYKNNLKAKFGKPGFGLRGQDTWQKADLLDTADYDGSNGKTDIPEGALPPPPSAIKPKVTKEGVSKGRMKIVADDPDVSNDDPNDTSTSGSKKQLGQDKVEIVYTTDAGITINAAVVKNNQGKWELDKRSKEWKLHDHFANINEDGTFDGGEFILKAPILKDDFPVYATGVDTTVNGRSDQVSEMSEGTGGMVDYRIPGTTVRGLEHYKRWRDSVGKDVVIIDGNVHIKSNGKYSKGVQNYLNNPKYRSGNELLTKSEFDLPNEKGHVPVDQGLLIKGRDAAGGDVYTVKGAVGAVGFNLPLNHVKFDLKDGNDILVIENDFGESAFKKRTANLDAGKGDDLLVVGSSHDSFTLIENLREDSDPRERFRLVDTDSKRKKPDGSNIDDAYDVEGKHRDPNSAAPQAFEDTKMVDLNSKPSEYNWRDDLRTPVIQNPGRGVKGYGGIIVNANIDMGEGNDTIIVTGTRFGVDVVGLGVEAISRSYINTGAGNDSIILAPNAVEGADTIFGKTTGVIATRGAIDTGAVIETKDGDDYIKGVQVSNGADIDMGADNDLLDMTRIFSGTGATAIKMGEGNDKVIIRGEARSNGGKTTTIDLGGGDDEILFRGNSDIYAHGKKVNGSFQASLDGGSGTDTFVLQYGARANDFTDGVHLSTKNFKNMEVIKMENGTKLKITASELLTTNNVKLLVQKQDGGDAPSSANRTVDLEGFNTSNPSTQSEGGKQYNVYTSTSGGKEVWIEDNANFMII